jgi:hypothetical protein
MAFSDDFYSAHDKLRVTAKQCKETMPQDWNERVAKALVILDGVRPEMERIRKELDEVYSKLGKSSINEQVRDARKEKEGK